MSFKEIKINKILELKEFARDIEWAKLKTDKIITDRVHLDFLNRLSLLYFDMNLNVKPTFSDMVVFSYFKPSKGMMKIWLRNYAK